MEVDKILFGDCRETLKEFDGKARTCVTSPPVSYTHLTLPTTPYV